MTDMSFFWWLAVVFFVGVALVEGAILIREHMRKKAIDSYDFRREDEYRQIARERDAWRMAYEKEHGIKVAQATTIEVQRILLRNKKVKDCGGHVGGKIGGRK